MNSRKLDLGQPAQVTHDPIVAANDEGQPPAFIVMCLEKRCGFAHDAHGLDANDAVQSIAPSHEPGHRLIAKAVDYTKGWMHHGKPLTGVPARTGPHPMYGSPQEKADAHA